MTSANDPDSDCGENTTGKSKVLSYIVIVVIEIVRRGLRSKPSKSSNVNARVSCLARSARKLKNTQQSPSRIGPTGLSPASTTVPGTTNSSVTPASYDF